MALAFPKNPIEGQVYDYPPFRYQFTSGRWLTVGKGANTVSEAVLAHEAAPNIHSMAAIQWQGGLSHRNLLINGDFLVNQRVGTTFSLSRPNDFTWIADRMAMWTGGSAIYYQSIAAVGGLHDAKWCTKLTGAAGNTEAVISQRIESLNCSFSVGQKVTFSCFVYCEGSAKQVGVGAEYMKAPDTIISGAQNIGGKVVSIGAGTWTKCEITVTVTNECRTNGMVVYLSVEGGVHAGQAVYTTNWQLERGEVATPFEHRPYGYELSLCQRYCRWIEGNLAISHVPVYPNSGWASASYQIDMRVIPTIISSTVTGQTNMNGSFASTVGGTSGAIRINPSYVSSRVYAVSLGGTVTPPSSGNYAYAQFAALLDAELY